MIPSNYFELRRNFLDRANNRGAKITSVPIRARGPAGEDLHIDFAWFGAEKPETALLHISGTHGVEGFAGSAIQSRLLDASFELPEKGAVIFVHALNPWGMAHLRRVNESNVDLNRNFLLAGEPFAGAPEGYKLVESFLNPPGLPSRIDLFYVQAVINVLRYGFSTLKQAIAGGQHEFEKGIFFGGKKAEQQTEIFQRFVHERLAGVKRAYVIEVHSGLGEWANDVLFWPLPLRHPKSAWLMQQTGETLTSDAPDESVGFVTPGDLQNEIPKNMPSVDFYWLVQEFGAYSPLRTLRALRDENRYTQSGGMDIQHWSKRALLEAFTPGARDWQEKVIARGQDLFGRMLPLLATPPPAAH